MLLCGDLYQVSLCIFHAYEVLSRCRICPFGHFLLTATMETWGCLIYRLVGCRGHVQIWPRKRQNVMNPMGFVAKDPGRHHRDKCLRPHLPRVYLASFFLAIFLMYLINLFQKNLASPVYSFFIQMKAKVPQEICLLLMSEYLNSFFIILL